MGHQEQVGMAWLEGAGQRGMERFREKSVSLQLWAAQEEHAGALAT